MQLPLSDEMTASVAKLFQALGEPMRLRLLQELEQGSATVGELAARLGTSQANASKHLKALDESGLVARRKEGLQVVVSVADPLVFQLCELVCGREAARARAKAAAWAESPAPAPRPKAVGPAKASGAKAAGPVGPAARKASRAR